MGVLLRHIHTKYAGIELHTYLSDHLTPRNMHCAAQYQRLVFNERRLRDVGRLYVPKGGQVGLYYGLMGKWLPIDGVDHDAVWGMLGVIPLEVVNGLDLWLYRPDGSIFTTERGRYGWFDARKPGIAEESIRGFEARFAKLGKPDFVVLDAPYPHGSGLPVKLYAGIFGQVCDWLRSQGIRAIGSNGGYYEQAFPYYPEADTTAMRSCFDGVVNEIGMYSYDGFPLPLDQLCRNLTSYQKDPLEVWWHDNGIYAMSEAAKEAAILTSAAGHLLALPSDSNLRAKRFWGFGPIRSDWLTNVQIGTPKTPDIAFDGSVGRWVRYYTNGAVVVNWTEEWWEAAPLDGKYMDYTNTVYDKSIVMGPFTGTVLRRY